MIDKDTIEMILSYRRSLEEEKATWRAQWTDIVNYMGLAYGEWKNPDDKKAKDYRITDITAADSSNLLADGVAGYAFNRSLDWFDFEPDIRKEGKTISSSQSTQIKKILTAVKETAYRMLSQSRFYIESRSFIRSCADLGTAVMYFDFDMSSDTPIFKTLHLQDVDLITDEKGDVTGIFRVVHLTRRQLEDFFGEDALPDTIKKESKTGRKTYDIIHLVSLATDWDFDIPGEGPYISVYLYEGYDKTLFEEKLLHKPFAVWRWQEQIYGGTWGVDSPGQMCLPIIRFVNLLQEDMIVLSELIAKGHWKKTKGLAVDFRAGGVTELEAGQDFVQMQHAGDLSWLSEHITYYRQVIQRKYNTEIFLVLTQNIERTKTATEVAGIETEKSNLMSSFFAQIDDSFLDPMLTWLFKQILIYAMPETLDMSDVDLIKQLDLSVDLVGPMYKEQQRNFRLSPTLQWIQDIVQIGAISDTLMSSVLDRIDMDKLIEIDHDIRGADPDVLIKKEDAAKARELRAQMLAQQNRKAEDAAALDQTLAAYDTLVNKGGQKNG